MATFTYAPATNSITLGWNANSEPDLAGYRLYWGTSSGVYPNNVDVHNVVQYTLSGVFLPNTIYYFALTAYNTNSQESSFSNEITAVVYEAIQMGGASASSIHVTRVYAGTGSMLMSGSSALAVHKQPAVSGSITMGGIGLYSFSGGGQFYYISSGSMVMDGTSDHSRDIVTVPDGGIVMGGASTSALASTRSIFSYTSVGGIVTSGSFPVAKVKSPTGDGGIFMNGQSATQFFINPPPFSYSYTSIGGMAFGGESGIQRDIVLESSGGIEMGGVSNAFIRLFGAGSIVYQPTVSGGIDMSGSSSLFVVKSYHSSDGIVMSGSSAVETVLIELLGRNRFRIYRRDCEVRVKQFGQDVPYTSVTPFGGPSHDDPSGAEI